MCDSQVNGCQLLAWPVLKAQTHIVPGQPALHVRVGGDVVRVVVVDVAESRGRQVYRERDQGQA